MSEEDIDDIYTFAGEYKGDKYFELEKKESKIPQEWIKNNCNDKTNYLTSDDFTDEDYSDMYTVKILNSRNKFDVGVCSTKEELIASLKSDLNFENEATGENPINQPSYIMTICTSPNDGNTIGLGSKPTIRIVLKITINNIYVTLGSVHRIMKEPDNKVWYALPMFDGKKRRVGNIDGIMGSSMTHCQLPGFIIYKLYTKNEIINSVKVKQVTSDYPIGYNLSDEVFTLYDLFDIYNISSERFVKKIVTDIDDLYLGKDTDTDEDELPVDLNAIEEKFSSIYIKLDEFFYDAYMETDEFDSYSNIGEIEKEYPDVNTKLQKLNTLFDVNPEFRLIVSTIPSFFINMNDPVFVNILRKYNNFNILIDEILAEQNTQVPQAVNMNNVHPVPRAVNINNVHPVPRAVNINNLPMNLANIPLNIPTPRAVNINNLPVNLANIPLNVPPRTKKSKKSKTSRASKKSKKSKTSRASKKSKTSRSSKKSKSKTSKKSKTSRSSKKSKTSRSSKKSRSRASKKSKS